MSLQPSALASSGHRPHMGQWGHTATPRLRLFSSRCCVCRLERSPAREPGGPALPRPRRTHFLGGFVVIFSFAVLSDIFLTTGLAMLSPRVRWPWGNRDERPCALSGSSVPSGLGPGQPCDRQAVSPVPWEPFHCTAASWGARVPCPDAQFTCFPPVACALTVTFKTGCQP